MPKCLSEAEIAAFHADGALAPIPILTGAEAGRTRAALEAYERSQAGRPREEVLFTLSRFKPHLLFTWLDTLCHHPRLLDAIEDVIGPDILVWSSAFFTKEARDHAHVPWHQDGTYIDLDGDAQVSAWVALSASTRASGCMRIIRGSHAAGPRPHREEADPDNLLFRKERLVEAPDESRALDLVLAPGEASLHHLNVVHGSDPNRAADRRIGFAVRFIGASVRPRGRRETAMLARGRLHHDQFDLEPRPAADLHPDAVAAHAGAMERRRAHFFRSVTPA